MTKQYSRKTVEIVDYISKLLKMGPPSNFDNLNKIEKEIIDILKDLVSKKEISQETFNEIKLIGSKRPRLYGLPKLHKTEAPLRPILSIKKSLQHILVVY